jgi:hypothetical protein
MYPPAPDMRAAATQRLSDGELFHVIENGVRLTGMPAWGNGTAEGERESWELVLFVRHLPQLDTREVQEMRALLPVSSHELREQEEERRFLAGEDVPPTVPEHQHPPGI